MSYSSREKTCKCITCKKDFHPLGIMSHRAMHRRKKEDCVIVFTNGDVYRYLFSIPPVHDEQQTK